MDKNPNRRLTIDIPVGAHRFLKAACAQKGVSMRDFVLTAITKEFEAFEDLADLQLAEETWKSIKSGATEVVPWEEMKSELGWHEL